jgi:NitT/TauT family transport system permease protein/sulfonate transport system permease protein
MKMNWKALAFLAGMLAFWHGIVWMQLVNTALFPGPFAVLEAGISWFNSGILLQDVGTSIWRLLTGLAIGGTLGILLGLAMGRIFFLEETAAPFFHILRAFPPVAIIPLIIVWLGIGDIAKIFSIAFAVFFPLWISTLIGVKSIPKEYLKVATLFSKHPLKTLTRVVIPAPLPFLVSGVRIAIGMGFIMVFVSELAGASSGLGYFIASAQIVYRVDQMMAGLIVLGLLSFLTDYLFVRVSQRLFPWVNVQ